MIFFLIQNPEPISLNQPVENQYPINTILTIISEIIPVKEVPGAKVIFTKIATPVK